jgi:hypothetical protein
MKPQLKALGAAAAIVIAGGLLAAAAAPNAPAKYTADGKLEFPKDYRTWVYLSSGIDMAYGPNGPAANVHVFDNVFVDRRSYEGFVKTGRWPEGSTFVLEIRRAAGEVSINKRGSFQTDRAAVEAHVKDKRFKSGWGFFSFRAEEAGTAFAQDSVCNDCHEKHGATDTTFVQFYPTLLPIARDKKTLTEAYLESVAPKVAVK